MKRLIAGFAFMLCSLGAWAQSSPTLSPTSAWTCFSPETSIKPNTTVSTTGECDAYVADIFKTYLLSQGCIIDAGPTVEDPTAQINTGPYLPRWNNNGGGSWTYRYSFRYTVHAKLIGGGACTSGSWWGGTESGGQATSAPVNPPGNAAADTNNYKAYCPSQGLSRWNWAQGGCEPAFASATEPGVLDGAGNETIFGPGSAGFTDVFTVYPRTSSYTFNATGDTNGNGNTSLTAMSVKDSNGTSVGTASCSNGACTLIATNNLVSGNPYTWTLIGNTSGTINYRRYTLNTPAPVSWTSWTPVLFDGTSSSGFTYVIQKGQYSVDSAGIVHAFFSIGLSAHPTASNRISIQGLPIPDGGSCAGGGAITGKVNFINNGTGNIGFEVCGGVIYPEYYDLNGTQIDMYNGDLTNNTYIYGEVSYPQQ